MKDNIVTIDGPSASGKGTLARNIAKYLGFAKGRSSIEVAGEIGAGLSVQLVDLQYDLR